MSYLFRWQGCRIQCILNGGETRHDFHQITSASPLTVQYMIQKSKQCVDASCNLNNFFSQI